ncbi:MAG: carboxypeptidase-like regulatory domain-containing protein, partial [Bacteroidales bacterium]|nr:carboxypeptidase-like regulatory domain-containing protein [Bacteroidales bacterium]
MKRIVSALISVFLFGNLFAQEFNLKGKVYGVDKTPLIAAYVCNLRTNDVQFTMHNGEYQIKVQAGDRIEYSYVGYQTAYRSVIVREPYYDVTLELEHSDPILVTATTSNTTSSIVSDVSETAM